MTALALPLLARAASAATALGLLAALGTPLTAAAAPNPSAVRGASAAGAITGKDPRVLFVEDFEHGMGSSPRMLDKYVGATGETYAADPQWLSSAWCNGIITSRSSSDTAGCSANAGLRSLAGALGEISGTDPATNHAVSAYTDGSSPGANRIQIESREAFSLGESGRFVSFGVSAAAQNCHSNHPLLDFLLVDDGTERPVSDRPLDPCTDPRSSDHGSVRGGEFVSSGGVLFSGDSLRWRLRNAQGSGDGNDGAFDRVTIVDSTPTLANEFSTGTIVGDTARMTVRVVNTSEHGAKPGWSFAETLPAGLTVAADPKTATTCAAPTLDVDAGASAVGASGGLAIDAPDCTVTFDVTAATAGTYTVAPDAVTKRVGLDAPAASSVTFAPERNELRADEQITLGGGNGDAVADLGETMTFRTVVENAGNVLVHDLDVSGTQGAVSCDRSELTPGASATCVTAARPVTQADVDRGSVEDAVTASASSRLGVPVSATAAATVSTTPSASAAELTVTPVTTGGAPALGDDVRLAVEVRNHGNVSLDRIAVRVDGEPTMTVDCPTGKLAPGATITCALEGAHRVTQGDVDAGTVVFHAAMTAVDTAGKPVAAVATATQETQTQAPALATTITPVLETAGKAPAVGDEVALTIAARNSGNVTLTDLRGVLRGRDGAADCPAGALAPGAPATCTLPSHVLTQDDLDRGEIQFEATASATGPKGQAVSASDSATVTLDRQHGIVATVTAALADDGAAPVAGDAVGLHVAVRNSGNVTLRDLTGEVDGRSMDVECADGAIAPGAEVTCTIDDHRLTQADVDRGRVSFDVSMTAATPSGGTASATDATEVQLARAPHVAVSATSVLDASEHEVPRAGDGVTVAITVRNTGNVTVVDVDGAVRDRKGMDVTCPGRALAPGEELTCVVTAYELGQDDVDAGTVRFEVVGSATGAGGTRVEGTASTETTIVRAASIAASTSARLESTGREHPVAGDTAALRVAVRNTGNVTATDLDGLVEGRDGMVVTCPADAIAPGGSAECASSTTVTQDEVDAGTARFTVRSTATAAGGSRVTAESDASVAIERSAAVTLDLTAHLADTERARTDDPKAGDHVSASISGTNAGNVTLRDAHTEVVELADMTVECAPGSVTPGATIDCTVPDHVLTQSDIDHGQVTIAAVLEATGPDGRRVTDRADVRVGLTAGSALDLTGEPVLLGSDGEPSPIPEGRAVRPGEQVAMRYEVLNTGNTTVDDVQRTGSTGPLTCELTTLEPGASTACASSAAHTVTAGDAERGEVVTVGRVKGSVTRADGETVEAPGAADTTQSGVRTRAAAVANGRVWVFSQELRTVAKAELEPQQVEGTEPDELAFTGSEITAVVLPAGIVLLLAGLTLLVYVRRRRQGDDITTPRS
ncbi:putative secreted protein [Curtobacterium sp. PhB130]|uniref:DUF7507 domain-containing protein n=1 Tax=Curtobacterium sp. PhB130 TaxID=2485178 RepID=UPI000FBD0AB8|nr:hypothetical protein [Curtobacterium sp. PhB130]ROS78287.1 putative secreted protein [Curtobacterium sp. PhB130]